MNCYKAINLKDRKRARELKQELTTLDPANKLFYITGNIDHFNFHYKEEGKPFNQQVFNKQRELLGLCRDAIVKSLITDQGKLLSTSVKEYMDEVQGNIAMGVMLAQSKDTNGKRQKNIENKVKNYYKKNKVKKDQIARELKVYRVSEEYEKEANLQKFNDNLLGLRQGRINNTEEKKYEEASIIHHRNTKVRMRNKTPKERKLINLKHNWKDITKSIVQKIKKIDNIKLDET